MQKLIQLTAAMVLMLIAFSSVAVLISRQNPINPITQHIPDIKLCAEYYCISNVIPGQTSWDEAEARLSDYDSDILGLTHLSPAGYRIHVYRGFDYGANSNQDTYVEIGLTSIDKPMLGEFIGYFGEPCSMTLTDTGVYLQYPAFSIVVDEPYIAAGKQLRLHIASPVSEIRIPGMSCASPTVMPAGLFMTASGTVVNSSRLSIPTRWYGFKLLDFYVAHRI
jgi:hypothetical protein